jgi:taurine transport system substrate-binding protein
VTKSLGLHAKEMLGVEIKYIKVGGGGDMLRAIAGDQVDFGGLGNPPTAIGVTRGLPMKGIMASRGYPTWDVGVVMNEFAEKYPDYVEKFVKAECAGIDYWLNNPEKTAVIIAKELELPLEDAARMMKGTEMVPCDKQLTADYIGTSANKGQFVDTLMSTADFLAAQERLPKNPGQATFENFMDPSYLEAVVK